MDAIVNYLEKNNLPVTRENYIGIAFMGDYPADRPLPAELESELPENLQIKEEDNADQE